MSQAIDKRETRRRRIARIRGTVVALSLAVFIALFAGLYVQMAAGRDPVLGSQAVTTTAGSGTSSSSGTASSPDSSSTASSDTGSSGTSSAVTTSQS